MLTSLLGIGIAFFVAFSIRGGLILRFGGMFLIIAGGITLFVYHNTAAGIVTAIGGFLMWLLGQWAYLLACDEYKSPIAEYLIEGMRLPQLEVARRLYAGQHLLVRGLQRARTKRVSTHHEIGGATVSLPGISPSPPDPQTIRYGVEQAGEAAADLLRPRLEATLEKEYGPDWISALNKQRIKTRGFLIADLADPRVVLHTLAFNPAFREEYARNAAKQLLELQNAAHHKRPLRDYELTRSWDLAYDLGVHR